MKVFYALLLVPLYSFAASESTVYPNSGATDGKTDLETTTTGPTLAPFSQGTDVVPAPAQEQQERAVGSDDFLTGPYDKDGNYMHVHKKP